uniref:G-protein coupled receptors family 2 profile 2 domain-containing protein n=1 Tax=Romanomermis culicivorax TaxID=13658 RepID=A0A915IEK6_ROMCU
FPAVPTIIYAILRYILDDEKCWLGSNIVWIEWVTYGPCIASLALNFLLMVSIIRVLITKLTHSPANEPAQYRKAVRATLVLLPLFGCHFFLTIYKFEHLLWYEILNKLLDGFQGLFVATIICFTHGENKKSQTYNYFKI